MNVMYDAFISYRHTPLDMEIAKKIHAGLETYHIPLPVQKKLQKRKMGRVFRDQEELPIGSDLNDNISEALKNSGYLVVICSPRTPESYWVLKEIETFIALHDREHVLAVLIEGEPDESFPALLLTDEKGNPVEPLAADVRGETPSERNRKMKTELLRLLAPILGCSYDDLKQRHKERLMKRAMTVGGLAAALVALVGTAFGIYNADVARKMKNLADEKSQLAEEKTQLAEEILEEFRDKQENQSRFYAEKSLTLLASGQREDAVLVALEGLPKTGDDRPYVPDAEYALSKALYAYDDGGAYAPDRVLPQELIVSSVTPSADRKRLCVMDNGYRVSIYDPSDWSLKGSIEAETDETDRQIPVKSADADDSGIYITTEHAFVKYGYDGTELYRVSKQGYYRKGYVYPDAGYAVVVGLDEILMIDLKTGKIMQVFENSKAEKFSEQCVCDRKRGMIIVGHSNGEVSGAEVSIFDLKSGEERTVSLSEGSILELYLTDKGTVAAASCNQNYYMGEGVKRMMLDLIDPATGNRISSVVPCSVRNPLLFFVNMKAHSFTEEEGTFDEIILTVESESFTFDEHTGKLVNRIILPDDHITLNLEVEGPSGTVGLTNGQIRTVNFHTGTVTDYSVETNTAILGVVYLDGKIAVRQSQSNEVLILSTHRAPDLKDLFIADERGIFKGISPEGSWFAASRVGDYKLYDFYDRKGGLLMTFDENEEVPVCSGFYDNVFCLFTKSSLYLIDPLKKSTEKLSLEAMGVQSGISKGRIQADGSHVLLWSYREIAVLDLKEKKCIFRTETDGVIGDAVLSEDGQKLYLSVNGNNLSFADLGTGEITVLKDSKLRALADSNGKEYMALSHDGRTLVICCMDGCVRVVDTSNGYVREEIPLETKTHVFVSFTADDRCFVLQGDDYRIRIRDVEKGEYVNAFEGYGELKEIICNTEKGFMAACDGSNAVLFETEGYRTVAEVPDAVAYIKDENGFLLCRSNRRYCETSYKDYEALRKESDVQFPGAELSDEKKVQYNIN